MDVPAFRFALANLRGKSAMKNKHVVIGVTGSVAAYKSAELVSRLKQKGADVYVVMTKNAAELVGPATFKALSGNPVLTRMFSKDELLPHIKLAEWMDILVIAPATANIIGKIANGIADDLLSTLVIAAEAPIIIAPAMNEKMYKAEIVKQNIDTLKKRGYHIIGPEEGFLACGYEGSGRLADIDKIIKEINKYLAYSS